MTTEGERAWVVFYVECRQVVIRAVVRVKGRSVTRVYSSIVDVGKSGSKVPL